VIDADELVERSGLPDVQWIVRQNLRKNRLRRLVQA
jgi:hypothetical protein